LAGSHGLSRFQGRSFLELSELWWLLIVFVVPELVDTSQWSLSVSSHAIKVFADMHKLRILR
jgi:hypothetical protein